MIDKFGRKVRTLAWLLEECYEEDIDWRDMAERLIELGVVVEAASDLKCGQCRGAQTIGDAICPACGGTGVS